MEKEPEVTVRDVVEKAGGVRGASSACGITTSAVHKWMGSEYIPPIAWPYLVTNYPDKITYEELELLFFQAQGQRERRPGGKLGA